jgi:hypothetical protein
VPEETIINKVAESGLVTLDLGELIPEVEVVAFDIKPLLFREMLLREKDFRAALKLVDWTAYAGKVVGITCSSDALLPQWSWMLVASYLQPVAARVILGDKHQVERVLAEEALSKIDAEQYRDQRVVVKGCGDRETPTVAFTLLVLKLQPVVRSIFFGEPCSTVPIWKRR